jgi:hypothetical protein
MSWPRRGLGRVGERISDMCANKRRSGVVGLLLSTTGTVTSRTCLRKSKDPAPTSSRAAPAPPSPFAAAPPHPTCVAASPPRDPIAIRSTSAAPWSRRDRRRTLRPVCDDLRPRRRLTFQRGTNSDFICCSMRPVLGVAENAHHHEAHPDPTIQHMITST